MKQQPLKLAIIVVGLMLISSGCKTKKHISPTSEPNNQIIIPCMGEEFLSDGQHLRATGVGKHQDYNMAKKKALLAAKTELSSTLRTQHSGNAEFQSKNASSNGTETSSSRFTNTNEQHSSANLSKAKVICEKYDKQNNVYVFYICLELALNDAKIK